MPVFNVSVPVVALVSEETPEDAYRRMESVLRAAGFEPETAENLPGDPHTVNPPFESEPGAVAEY